MFKLRRGASSLGPASVAAVLAPPAYADALAAFVTLGGADSGEPFALARVIVYRTGAHCPALKPIGGRAEQPMTSRCNPDPTHFDVTVCEAGYPTEGSRLKVSGLKVAGADLHLPGAPAAVSRSVIFGDAGCNPKHQIGRQPGKHWPFGELANAAAESGTQLVVHVGDYNYRGTSGKIEIRQSDGHTQQVRVYDASDNTPSVTCTLFGPYIGQNSAGSTSPDAWKPWQEDFFEPARSLLHVTPWVFARSNHELCSRAGPGYFYLLDSGSDLVPASGGQLACPPAAAAEPLVFESLSGLISGSCRWWCWTPRTPEIRAICTRPISTLSSGRSADWCKTPPPTARRGCLPIGPSGDWRNLTPPPCGTHSTRPARSGSNQ